jgi:hypothetical protein
VSASDHISHQFREPDENDEGPYCPDCAEDVYEWDEAVDYWNNERAKIRPENRTPCKGCGVR